MPMKYSLLPIWALLCLSAIEAQYLYHPARAIKNTDAPSTGYRRYHANDSFIGKSVPCTDDEKTCFRYNTVLDSTSDTCQPIGEGRFDGCILRVNGTEYMEGSGHVVGTCRQYEDPCPGYRMAYDNRCYKKEVVQKVICDCGVPPTLNWLGNWECRCTPSLPKHIVQPKESGRCTIPDLRFPVNRDMFLFSDLKSMKFFNNPCGSEQRKCFSRGKVWVEKARGCYTLLEQGPCAEDEVVVLTKQKWVSGSAVCKKISGGCPPGKILMAFDGQCHSEREMKLSAPGRLAMNIIGKYEVLDYETSMTYTPESQVDNTCGFTISAVGGAPPLIAPKPLPCTGDVCKVYDFPPSPEN